MRILRFFLMCFLLPVVLFLSAHAQTYSLLYSFTGGADGASPQGQMLIDASGNLFGTTYLGGNLSSCSGGCGVVFQLDSITGVLSVLHTFSGQDGQWATGNMASDGSNELYGTTSFGGSMTQSCAPSGKTQGCGVIYKLNKVTKQFAVLHRFAGGSGGDQPFGVIRDAAGNLYGTTFTGGVSGCYLDGSCGIIYKLDPSGNFSVLYTFTGGADGGVPISVIRDNAGNLYGTTIEGGDLQCQPGGCGVVFELTTAGTLKVLHTFTGKDGDNNSAVGASNAGLIRSTAGNLFGTSLFGGLNKCTNYPGCGLIFEVTTAGKEIILYRFTGRTDGAQPTYTLTENAGNLYGTTTLGGYFGQPCFPGGCGTVFKFDSAGQLTTLYTFMNGADGFYPTDLTADSSGTLYGETASGGGSFGTAGTIFKIVP